MKDPLPECPCGSGRVYEECCWNVHLPDGSRRFHAGMAVRGDDNERWHPIPNARLAVTMVGTRWDEYRRRATELSAMVNLPDTQREKLVDLLSVFLKAHADLKDYLSTPQARGISMSLMSTELKGFWWQYISTGRQLLDFAGLRSRWALGLQDEIGGLNRRSFATLMMALGKNADLAEVRHRVATLEGWLNDLIDIRDQEKGEGATIAVAPTISPEGKSTGGVIKIKSKSKRPAKDLDLCAFLDGSVEAVVMFVRIILGGVPSSGPAARRSPPTP